MARLLKPKPGLLLRVAQFPLTRLLVLGAAMLFLIGVANGLREALAGSPALALAAAAAVSALALGVYAGFVRLVERRPVSELSLPGMAREWGAGAVLGAGLYSLAVLVLVLLGIYRVDGLNPWSYLLPALGMAVSSGIIEELLFRGVVFRVVEETLGSWVALVLSSALFGAAHLVNPQATLTGALFISVEAGVLLAAAYMLTRRLWLAIGLHMAWNYTQSAVFSGVVSGSEGAPGLVQATIDGPELLTGGAFGLESSVIAAGLCTAAGLAMLVQAVRRGRVVAPFWKR
jgi:uncharacterized protein